MKGSSQPLHSYALPFDREPFTLRSFKALMVTTLVLKPASATLIQLLKDLWMHPPEQVDGFFAVPQRLFTCP